jgi:hypothetical protein
MFGEGEGSVPEFLGTNGQRPSEYTEDGKTQLVSIAIPVGRLPSHGKRIVPVQGVVVRNIGGPALGSDAVAI